MNTNVYEEAPLLPRGLVCIAFVVIELMIKLMYVKWRLPAVKGLAQQVCVQAGNGNCICI